MSYPCLSSLLESRVALRIKHSYEKQAGAYNMWDENAIVGRRWNITYYPAKEKWYKIEIIALVINGSVKLTFLLIVRN